ncbi:MAG: autotransporter outer membrane beta-barrel domain-containing protein [Deltaproteobacteria bacterium]|jgi:hypothetical protein|nr:autotransporter outer membrane beta-barrel domain-containing protein [Deltaproteobacteria bacterium]
MGGLVNWRPKSIFIFMAQASRVLAISALLVLGLSWGALANPIDNVTINGSIADDSIDNFYIFELGGNVIIPGDGIDPFPENNKVGVNGTVDPNFQGVAGGAGFWANTHHNRVVVNESGYINGSVYGAVTAGTFDAFNNTVVIDTPYGIFQNANAVNPSQTTGHVFGGYVENGLAENNTVVILNGEVSHEVAGGVTNASGLVRFNQAILNGVGVKVDSVYGGRSLDSGRVENNAVIIYNGAVSGTAAGGHIAGGKGSIVNNSVTLYNGVINGQIYGGSNNVLSFSDPTNVTNNAVIIHGGEVKGEIAGGFSASGRADYNTVQIDNATASVTTDRANTDIYGGQTSYGSAIGNKVTIATMADLLQVKSVNGGYSYNSGSVTKNTVKVATVNASDIIGGYSGNGDVFQNQVTVIYSLAENIYGGYGVNGNVSLNSVSVSDVNVSNQVVGGFTENGLVANGFAEVSSSLIANVYGGYASIKGAVYNSSARVVGGEVSNDVYGGYSTNGTVAKGAATVMDSNVTRFVYGGYSGNGSVADSSALIMGTKAASVGGGYSKKGSVTNGTVAVLESNITGNVSGGYSEDGPVTDSHALVSFSQVSLDVYGGYALNGSANYNDVEIVSSKATNVIGGYSAANGEASFNKVFVESSNVSEVLGGYSLAGDANNNYVVLAGKANVSTRLAGGRVGVSGANAYANNTLVLLNYDPSGGPIAFVENFQYYNFYLPSAVKDGFVALQATNVDLGTNASSQWIHIDDLNGAPDLAIGDAIILINATAISGNFPDATVQGDIGFFFENDYDVHLDPTAKRLTATVASSPRLKDRVKSVAETSAARLAFVTQGQDYLVDQGLSLAKTRAGAEGGFAVFAGFSGGKSRYETGSHVDLSGINALIGVSMSNYFDQNRLTLGLFGEFGFGSYDSDTGARYGSMEAEGDVSYVGAGLLGRFDLETNLGTYYVEASGRIGEAKVDYEAKTRFNGRRLRFDASGTYVGAHLGTGFDFQVTKEANLDVYVKYLWNRQEGSEERLLGQKFALDAAKSSRVKTGARFSYLVNDFIKPYLGGAYIYEFAGEADGNVRGISLPNADLKGSSGLAELGLSLLSHDAWPISLDFGVQGYFGQRQGLSGSLEIKYEF